jgi:hypothetical protein
MAVANKAFRVSKLNTQHTNSLNQLSSTPQSLAAHAASLGITTLEASHRLQLLVDEGLAIAGKTAKGAPDGTFTLAP